MLRRIPILLIAGALVLAIGGGSALADGAVKVTSSTDCADPDLQDNQFSGLIFVFLHESNAEAWPVSVTYRKTGHTSHTTLEFTCEWNGWFLYGTDQGTSEGGAATVVVYDPTDTKIGADTFLSTA